MILPSIVRWLRDLAKMPERHILCYRSLAFWLLGHPEAALADADHAISDAREIGQAGHFDGCAGPYKFDPHFVREPRRFKGADR